MSRSLSKRRPITGLLVSAVFLAASFIADTQSASAQVFVPAPPPPAPSSTGSELTGRDILIGVGIAVGIGLVAILIQHLRNAGPPPEAAVFEPPPNQSGPPPSPGTDQRLSQLPGGEGGSNGVGGGNHGGGSNGNGGGNGRVVRVARGRDGSPPRGETRFVPNEVLVQFSASASPQAIDQIARRYNLTRLESQTFPLTGISLYRWRIGGGRTVASVITALQNEGAVTAQPNYLFSLQQNAPPPAAGTQGDTPQYALAKMEIAKAHELATGRGVLVAVIDSEIDDTHPDLDGQIASSFNALDKEGSPHLHGTAMAGAIASHGKLLGIAPGAHLLAARAFDDSPGEAKGTSFAIYKSLQWAVDNHARVINMSFAGPPDPGLNQMVEAAYAKDIVLIAAAGNAGPKSPPLYPAADAHVIAVTATDSDDHLFKMANHGRYITVAAPGVEVLVLAPDGSYDISTGTSIAAAEVSGIAALLLERKTTLKPDEIRTMLTSTAKPLGAKNQRTEFGAGLVDAFRAVSLAAGKTVDTGDAHRQAKR